MKTMVVYYQLLVNNWDEHLLKYLKKSKEAGLYDAADAFYLTVVDFDDQKEKLETFLLEYPKVILKYYTEMTPNNPNRSLGFSGEYWGINLVDELGREHDDAAILYIHGKGTTNRSDKWGGVDESRVRYQREWADAMIYFLIGNWRECLEKLQNGYDTVGLTNVGGWYWGNFWWTTADHVKKNRPFPECYIDRWSAEAWLIQKQESEKIFEWWHWTHDPVFTNHPSFLYDNSYCASNKKIIIHKAEFGWHAGQRDEAQPYFEENLVDVTDKIINMMNEEGTELINQGINENTLNIDAMCAGPCEERQPAKHLFITYSYEDRPEEILTYANFFWHDVKFPISQPPHISC